MFFNITRRFYCLIKMLKIRYFVTNNNNRYLFTFPSAMKVLSEPAWDHPSKPDRMTYEVGYLGLSRRKAEWVGNSNHLYSGRKYLCKSVIRDAFYGVASPGRQIMWERNNIWLRVLVSVWAHYSPSVGVPHHRLTVALHRDYSMIRWVPWNPTSTAVSPWPCLLLPASAYLCLLGCKDTNLFWKDGK